jgi:hypothetical protein
LSTIATLMLSASRLSRRGPVLEAGGDGLRWLEWSVAEDADTEDLRTVAAGNPLRTVAELREHRWRCSEIEWLQFVCCRWGVGSVRWLAHGAWQECRAVYEIDPAAPLVLGVDVGGSRSATAVVGCVPRDDGDVDVALAEIWQGNDAVLQASAYVESLIAAGRAIREVMFDPMRFSSEALRLERDHGLALVEWPQTLTRMTICSERLHALVVEKPAHRHLEYIAYEEKVLIGRAIEFLHDITLGAGQSP